VTFSSLIFFNKVIQKSDLLLVTCASFYNSFQEAIVTMPIVSYGTATRRQRVRKRQENDGSTFGPDALNQLSLFRHPKQVQNK